MEPKFLDSNKSIPNPFVTKGSIILPAFILFGLTLFFLHKLASLDFVTIGHVEDHLRQFYPYRTYDADMLKSFKIPLWNPYTFGGFPYLASLRCHVFYPLNLIFLLLPTHIGMNISYILHVFLSGLFMYGLARTLRLDIYCALISAVSFMFCGFLIDKVSWGHLTMVGSACWFPLLFMLFIKAVENQKMVYAVGAGIIFAIQLFSGHPQLPYYGILTLCLFILYSFLSTKIKGGSYRTAAIPLVFFIILILVGVGLAAIQNVPAAELSRHSFRSAFDDKFAFYTRWSMEPSYLSTFFFPRLSPAIGTNSYPFPVSLGYMGIIPLVLAFLSLFRVKEEKYILFFWMTALSAVILALGRYTSIYYLFYHFLPGISTFRNPIFFLYVYVFSMALLSGFGMDYIQKRIRNSHDEKFRFIIITTVLICFSLMFISFATYFFPYIKTHINNHGPDFLGFSEILNNSFINYLWIQAQKYRVTLIYDFAITALILGATLFTFAFAVKSEKRKIPSRIIIISLIFIELFIYGKNFIKVYNLRPFVSKGQWVDFLKKDKQPYRVLPMLPYPEQDPMLKLNKIQSINGYGSLEILQNYVEFLSAFQDQILHQDACLTRVKNYNSKAVNLMNTKYVLTNNPINHSQFQLVSTDEISKAKTWDPENGNVENLYIYRNNHALPRAFFIEKIKVVKNKEDILKIMKQPEFDPSKTIILEKKLSTQNPPTSIHRGPSEIEFVKYEPEKIVIKAKAPINSFLFLSEIYYPGWKVFIDGKQEEIYKADYLFRAVYLEKGVHNITFIFDPVSYKIGRIISLVTLTFLIFYFGYIFYQFSGHGRYSINRNHQK